MNFQIDNQTLKDLEISSTGKGQKTVFDIYNKTQSLLGKKKLYDYLSHPLTDFVDIKNRIDAISFFQYLDCKKDLDIDKNALDFIEHYLNQGNYPTTPPSKLRAIEKAFIQKINPTSEYYIIERGIDYIIYLLNNLYDFSLNVAKNDCPQIIEANNTYISQLLGSLEFKDILKVKEMQKLKPLSIATYDYMFRYTHKDSIRNILNIIYEYDVFISVSQVATENGFSYPEILPAQESVFEIKELHNPLITNPVKKTTFIFHLQKILLS